MISSIFLAQVLGVYMLIAGLTFLLFKRKVIPRFVEDFIQRVSLRYFISLWTIIVGLIIVFGHNVWTGWPVVITIIGYLILLKGLVLLWWPSRTLNHFMRGLAYGAYKWWTVLGSIIVFGLGVYLALRGFSLI